MLNESLLQEIEESILSQGELSKQDILDTWEVDDTEYPDVRKALLQRGAVTSGPKRTGGLIAKRKRDHPPSAEEAARPLLGEKWEEEVVTYLMAIPSEKSCSSEGSSPGPSFRRSRRTSP